MRGGNDTVSRQSGTGRSPHRLRCPRRMQLKPVSDSHALTVGAEFVSQTFLLTVGIGLVVFVCGSLTSTAAAVQAFALPAA